MIPVTDAEVSTVYGWPSLYRWLQLWANCSPFTVRGPRLGHCDSKSTGQQTTADDLQKDRVKPDSEQSKTTWNLWMSVSLVVVWRKATKRDAWCATVDTAMLTTSVCYEGRNEPNYELTYQCQKWSISWHKTCNVVQTHASSFSMAAMLLSRIRSFSSSLRTTRFCDSTWCWNVTTCSATTSFSSRSSFWIWFALILCIVTTHRQRWMPVNSCWQRNSFLKYYNKQERYYKVIHCLTCSPPGQILPRFHPQVGLLPRCQLVICCGAGVRPSYMSWIMSILASGTYWYTLINEITRQWQRTC